MTLPYPDEHRRQHLNCPHQGHCSAATGCHDGEVRGTPCHPIKRDDWWYTRAWFDDDGPIHESAIGEEPYVPRMNDARRIAESLEGVGVGLLDVILEEAAEAGVVGLRGIAELVVVALGLGTAETIALGNRIASRAGKAARVKVRRGVAR